MAVVLHHGYDNYAHRVVTAGQWTRSHQPASYSFPNTSDSNLLCLESLLKMVGKQENFFISSSRVLLWSSATFIMLSGAVTADRQCYWCGPLAEQVHRSRRAPPCDDPTGHVTTCEPGLMHCAIVATSPPHVESRFCVKLYQDECYPLFCNSTKTWKMTCPCRGNLCNGNSTERESEAFAALSKLAARSQDVRIKKRAAAASDFVTSKRERTIIITNLTDLHQQMNRTTDDGIDEIDQSENMIVVTSTAREHSLRGDARNKSPTTTRDLGKSSNETLEISQPDLIQKLEEMNPTSDGIYIQENITSNSQVDDLTTPIPDNDELYVKLNASTTIPKRTDAIYVAETTTIKEAEINMNAETTERTEIINETATTKETEANTGADTITPLSKNKVVPSEQLPTAEALQQNASPSTTSSRTTEIIKADPTEPSTIATVENATVMPTKAGASYSAPIAMYIYPWIALGPFLIAH
ncbi:unnamed protein product, partial [Iphiclides podalirius]